MSTIQPEAKMTRISYPHAALTGMFHAVHVHFGDRANVSDLYSEGLCKS